MTKALFNTLLFETVWLAISALAWVLGQPAVSLFVFAASHLPSSLLMFPILMRASVLFDVYMHDGGPWPSFLPLFGAGVVVGIQAPLLIACFRWHMADGRTAEQGEWRRAVRSLGVFSAASVAAALVVVACLWLTPILSYDNCIPLPSGMSPPKPVWQLNGCDGGSFPFRVFNTLRNDRYGTATTEWWGLFEYQSPWRFAMLGLYTAIGFLPALWIAVRWRVRGHRRDMSTRFIS
jgi:hypothetical protein